MLALPPIILTIISSATIGHVFITAIKPTHASLCILYNSFPAVFKFVLSVQIMAAQASIGVSTMLYIHCIIHGLHSQGICESIFLSPYQTEPNFYTTTVFFKPEWRLNRRLVVKNFRYFELFIKILFQFMLYQWESYG